jgi:hypothetical protein
VLAWVFRVARHNINMKKAIPTKTKLAITLCCLTGGMFFNVEILFPSPQILDKENY